MNIKLWMTVHVVSLLAIAGSSVAEGFFGAEFSAIPLQVAAGLGAAAGVLWKRSPTIGLIIAGWLSLGPFFMSYVRDNMDSGSAGLIASTVVYLVAIVIALISGALALVEIRRRDAHADALTGPYR